MTTTLLMAQNWPSPANAGQSTMCPRGGNSSANTQLLLGGLQGREGQGSGYVAGLPEQEPEVGHDQREPEEDRLDPGLVAHEPDRPTDERDPDHEAEEGDAHEQPVGHLGRPGEERRRE